MAVASPPTMPARSASAPWRNSSNWAVSRRYMTLEHSVPRVGTPLPAYLASLSGPKKPVPPRIGVRALPSGARASGAARYCAHDERFEDGRPAASSKLPSRVMPVLSARVMHSAHH